jgi:hypothetical protein
MTGGRMRRSATRGGAHSLIETWSYALNYQTTHEEVQALRSDRERVTDLLGRYPGLSESEVREVLTFLKTGRHLDVGLLTSNDRIRPKLDQFMDDHKSHFRVKLGEGALLVGGIIAFLAIAWLVWEAFR